MHRLQRVYRYVPSLLLAAAAVLYSAQPAICDEWPQWRGPERTGISAETGLLKSWPAAGPRKLWSLPGVGQGYSTVAVTGDAVYATGMEGGTGYFFIIGLDGTVRSKTPYGPEADDGQYKGARSTPTVDAGRAYVMSGLGVVTCFDAQTGAVQWQVDTAKVFGARNINWRMSESLLIDGDRLVCTPGGAQAAVVALDKTTGKTVWKSPVDDKSAYCSPLLVKDGSKASVITLLEKGVYGFDAASGKELWFFAHQGKYGVHAATPIHHDGAVFISSGYNFGGRLLKIGKSGASEAWFNKDLANHHGGVILSDGVLVGTNDKGWVGVDWKSGTTLWQDKLTGKGSLVMAGGLFYGYGQSGTVGLISAGKTGASMISSFKIAEGGGEHWAHPVVAVGRLYIRHGDVLMAFSVKD